jgi:hypothetical protein
MAKEKFVIVAYFTKGTPYEEHVKKLIRSLNVFALPYDIKPIEDMGDWYSNMQYKPTFILEMLQKYPKRSIVYVDVDAVFFRYPEYFNYLDNQSSDEVAVHVLDHSQYGKNRNSLELLRGTIYFRNTEKSSIIIREWIEECKKDAKLWDQKALATVLENHSYHLLPAEYTTIFDYMSSIKHPVIKHFQASRQNKNRRSACVDSEPKIISKTVPKTKPRIVQSEGVNVKIGRVHGRRTV